VVFIYRIAPINQAPPRDFFQFSLHGIPQSRGKRYDSVKKKIQLQVV